MAGAALQSIHFDEEANEIVPYAGTFRAAFGAGVCQRRNATCFLAANVRQTQHIDQLIGQLKFFGDGVVHQPFCSIVK